MPSSFEDGEVPEDIAALLTKGDVSYERETIDVPPEEFTDDGGTGYTNRFVGCVVKNPADELLLVKHGDDPHKAGWVIPGGAVEPGESFEEAARRELIEETGIECRVRRPTRVTEQLFRNEADHARTSTGYFVLFLGTPESGTLTADPGTAEEGIVDADWFESVPEETPQPDLLEEFLG